MAYNGWTNYQTWLVALHTSYELECYTRDTIGGEIDAEQVRNYVEEFLDIESTCNASILASDLANAMLDKVNWQELADITNMVSG